MARYTVVMSTIGKSEHRQPSARTIRVVANALVFIGTNILRGANNSSGAIV
jgi:hypothetical protein